MGNQLFKVIVMALSIANSAQADNGFPVELAKIKAQYGISNVRYFAKGSLDDTGRDYYAALYESRKGEDDNDTDVAVVLFVAGENGDIKKVDESKSWQCSEYREGCSLSIKNGSLYMYHTGSGGWCTHGDDVYQFKFRDGMLRLIGTESLLSSCDTMDRPVLYTIGKSVNFLSGKFIVWYESGSDARDNVIYRFKNNHHERKFEFSADKVWTLGDFSEEAYMVWVSRTKEICQHFDYSAETGKFSVEQC